MDSSRPFKASAAFRSAMPLNLTTSMSDAGPEAGRSEATSKRRPSSDASGAVGGDVFGVGGVGLDPHLALDAVRRADPGDEDAVGPGDVGHGQRLARRRFFGAADFVWSAWEGWG